MPINVYLNFNGNCREAVEFYAQVFKTEKPQFMTYGEAPPNPEYAHIEETKNLIMHTRLSINGSLIMFSDTFPGSSFVEGNNISLVVVSKDKEELESYFNQLKVGGTIEMDLQETFWSKCYGSLRDKYGIAWQVSYNDEE